jgi:hypothetical protein
LNFLDLLRAGHTDYVINDAALSYMRGRSLAGPVTSQLGGAARAHFANMKRGDRTARGFRGTFREWCADATNYPREVAGTYSARQDGGSVSTR